MEEVTFLELVNKYVDGKMNPSEKVEFETYLSNNMTAQKQMAEHIETIRGIRSAARENLRQELQRIREQMESPLEATDGLSTFTADSTRPFSLKRWIPYVAAVFFLGMIAYFNFERSHQVEVSYSYEFGEEAPYQRIEPEAPENSVTQSVADLVEPTDPEVAAEPNASMPSLAAPSISSESLIRVRILPKVGMMGSPTAEPFFLQVNNGNKNEFRISQDTLIIYMDLKKEGLLYENQTKFTILGNGILEVMKDSISLRFQPKK